MKNKRSEQTRILTRRVVAWTAVALAAYTLVFGTIAVAVDRFASPVLGNIVADVVSPWEYLSNYDAVWYIEDNTNVDKKMREVKADVARNYVNAVVGETVEDANTGLEISPLDTEGQDADVAQTSGEQGQDQSASKLVEAYTGVMTGNMSYLDATEKGSEGASDVENALSNYSDYGESAGAYGASTNKYPVNQIAAYLVAVARDTDFSDARAQGLITSDAVQSPDSSSPYAEASDSIMSAVKLAVDLRNSGAAANVYDGVWLITKGWSGNSDLESLYAEAARAMGADISQKIVYSSIGNGSSTEVVIYADGHGVRRDLTAYNQIKELKLPVALTAYLLGCLVIMAFAVKKSLGYFDTLFSSVGAILSKREADDDSELPSELALAQKTIDDIRLRNELDERAAEAAERRKNELVAYLAHDTKTPLTSIAGYLSLLEEAPDMPVEQRRRYAHTALQKAYRLDGMLDEFFEITRYNLHAIVIEREHFDPALLCFQVAEEFYPEASSRGIEIDVDANEGSEIFADARKLSRALSNVVKNAVAYADSDSKIEIRVRRDDAKGACEKTMSAPCDSSPVSSSTSPDSRKASDSDSPVYGGELRISVENRGREISKEHLDRIFDKFYREDDARATNRGGAGLGLAIAREIVQAHGGSISAQSERGRTVFTLCIPTGE